MINNNCPLIHLLILRLYSYLDNISSGDRALKTQAERQAINTVIQGSAADLMKIAMLKMASRITDWRKEGTGNGETGTPPRML